MCVMPVMPSNMSKDTVKICQDLKILKSSQSRESRESHVSVLQVKVCHVGFLPSCETL